MIVLPPPFFSLVVVDDGKSALRIALVTVRLKVDLTSLPPSMANRLQTRILERGRIKADRPSLK